MSVPFDGPRLLETLEERRSELASASEELRVLASVPVSDPLAGDFDAHLARAGLHPLRANGVRVLQLNLGKVCNQTCAHCHVDAGPTRTEQMSRATAELALRVLSATDVPVVDLTGGAPEMNPNFRLLVEGAKSLGRHVMDRCNLTILATSRGPELVELLAANDVEVVASLPHYRAPNTDAQRGAGVFARSLAGLALLNAAGYGKGDPKRRLVLVTNPVGAFLPSSSQAALKAEWKREMRRLHQLEFDDLFTITNMPIRRYLDWLRTSGNLETYLQKLVTAFNPSAARGVMCRDTLSVGWDGRLYDCDFNQMLDLEIGHGFADDERAPAHLADLDVSGIDPNARASATDPLARLASRRIVTRRHCFGCTAGAGSSCGGQTA